MKFINMHLKNDNNKKFAVNPMMITAVKPLDGGGSRIYYTLLSQHDDVTEEYDTLMMQINDILEGLIIMKFNPELKMRAEALAEQLIFINSKSITPGDPKDKDPVFVYTSGGFYRQTLEQSAALLEELAAVMEV